MDCGTVIRDVTSKDIERMGKLVTIEHFEKLGSDTEGYGTYDEATTTYTNVKMIISEPPTLKELVMDEGVTEARYHIGQVKYDQNIYARDLVTLSNGEKYVVVGQPWELDPSGVLVCKFARLQRYAVSHAT